MSHYATQSDHSQGHQLKELMAPAATTAAYLWSRTPMVNEVLDLVRALEAWPGVATVPDCSGLCITLRGAALGHLRWNGQLDLPFGPEIRDQLVAEMMASRNPDEPDAGRVVFVIRTAADVDHAIWLLRLAYLSIDSKLDPCATAFAR